MSDTQYEVIKETFPKWANTVERYARKFAKQCSRHDEYYLGLLNGLSFGAVTLGMVSEANEFIELAVQKAMEGEEERINEKV